MFSAARISSQPVFSELSAARRTRVVFARKTSPVRVQGTYEELRDRLASLSVRDPIVWAAPARRAAFKPPRFEVNRLFQSFCSAAHPVDFSFEKPRGADHFETPMKHRKPPGFPSPFVTRSSGPSRRGGRLLNPPDLKSIDKSQRCAVRSGWPENRRKTHCPAHRFEAPALP